MKGMREMQDEAPAPINKQKRVDHEEYPVHLNPIKSVKTLPLLDMTQKSVIRIKMNDLSAPIMCFYNSKEGYEGILFKGRIVEIYRKNNNGWSCIKLTKALDKTIAYLGRLEILSRSRHAAMRAHAARLMPEVKQRLEARLTPIPVALNRVNRELRKVLNDF